MITTTTANDGRKYLKGYQNFQHFFSPLQILPSGYKPIIHNWTFFAMLFPNIQITCLSFWQLKGSSAAYEGWESSGKVWQRKSTQFALTVFLTVRWAYYYQVRQFGAIDINWLEKSWHLKYKRNILDSRVKNLQIFIRVEFSDMYLRRI